MVHGIRVLWFENFRKINCCDGTSIREGRVKIFGEDLVGIHMFKPVLVMNWPIQVGFAILDLSKYLMYDFHYNTWMKKFPNSTFLFTDRLAIIWSCWTWSVCWNGWNQGWVWFFRVSKRSLLTVICDNMKVVGKFKDECKGYLMLRFVGLRPKLYSFDYERGAHFDCKNGVEEVEDKSADTSVTRIVLDNKVTAKGVKSSVMKKLSFGDYKYCSNYLLPKRLDIRRICSRSS